MIGTAQPHISSAEKLDAGTKDDPITPLNWFSMLPNGDSWYKTEILGLLMECDDSIASIGKIERPFFQFNRIIEKEAKYLGVPMIAALIAGSKNDITLEARMNEITKRHFPHFFESIDFVEIDIKAMLLCFSKGATTQREIADVMCKGSKTIGRLMHKARQRGYMITEGEKRGAVNIMTEKGRELIAI